MSKQTVSVIDPVLDDPQFWGFGLEERGPVGDGDSFIDDFRPPDTSTREWQAQRLASRWPKVRLIGEEPGQINDYPCVGLLVPCFSERAVNCMRDLLEPHGELLPAQADHATYYVYNVTTVVDALDHEKSDIKWGHYYRLKRMEGKPKVLAQEIRRYEFKPDIVRDLTMFRLVERLEFFVTSRFVDRVRECGLRGFSFQQVWEERS